MEERYKEWGLEAFFRVIDEEIYSKGNVEEEGRHETSCSTIFFYLLTNLTFELI